DHRPPTAAERGHPPLGPGADTLQDQLDPIGRRQGDQRLGPRLLEAQYEVAQEVQERDRHGEPPQRGRAVGGPRGSITGWHARVLRSGIPDSKIPDSKLAISQYSTFLNFQLGIHWVRIPRSQAPDSHRILIGNLESRVQDPESGTRNPE